MTRPDVLLVTVDALRHDIVGRTRDSSTPAMDALAAESIRFDLAMAGGAWTLAAMPALLTSTHASMYGGCDRPLAKERPSPVQALRNDGYTTAAFVANPLCGRRYGYHRAFHVFEELQPAGRDPWLRHVRGGQRLLRSEGFQRLGALAGSALAPAQVYAPGARLTERALEWLEIGPRPRFVWLHYMDAHWPYHDPGELHDPRAAARAWRDVAHYHRIWEGTADIDSDYLRRLQGLYEGAVARADAAIGRLFDRLRERGALDECLVVVCADHGEAFGEHGSLGHRELNLREELLRIPLIVRPPGGVIGRRETRLVRALDVMPTILRACECPPPDGLLGTPLQPLWESPTADWRVSHAISEQGRREHHVVAVRSATHRWIWDARTPDTCALFDLGADPGETTPITSSSHEARFREILSRHLDAVRASRVDAADGAPTVDEALRRRLRALGYLG